MYTTQRASLVAQTIKNPPAGSGSGRAPGEGMATHSNILTWRSPWTEEPGELYSPWGRRELDMTEQLNDNMISLTHDLFESIILNF